MFRHLLKTSRFATVNDAKCLSKLLRRCSRMMCTVMEKQSAHGDPGKLFLRNEVQDILKKMTGFDLDKIFAARQTADFGAPKYKLMTDEELQAAQAAAVKEGREHLQMPPIMKSWTDDSEVLSDDKEIDGHHTDTFVFTDITYGIKRRLRTVTMREPNGLLRTASSEERDRILQVYFPEPGRMFKTPEMFSPESMEVILGEGRYEYVLDRACVQFEPDDPEYARVVQRVYEHMDSTCQYDQLHSTRHFGGMAFYYALYKKIDGLLVHFITQGRLDSAVDLIQLYHIAHPDTKSALKRKESSDLPAEDLIMLYSSTESLHPGKIELALQTLKDKEAASA